MKKILSLVLCFCFLCSISSCTKKTEYDNKTVARIEVASTTSFAYTQRIRTFDFTTFEIIDAQYVEESYFDYQKESYISNPEFFRDFDTWESYEEYLHSVYNIPKVVSTFTQEVGDAFIKKVISLGIYTWKDSYRTNDIIVDASGFSIKIYFTDDTV
ncbi:MAG: hypothetical protein K2N42_03170, partial [Anaeroplasmataceae bacterium]|nr:hypothetical protein [Anaeroplasmataceae bacterium]